MTNRVKKFTKGQLKFVEQERRVSWDNGWKAGFQTGKSAGEIDAKNNMLDKRTMTEEYRRREAVTRVLEGYSKMMETVAQSLTTIAGEIGR